MENFLQGMMQICKLRKVLLGARYVNKRGRLQLQKHYGNYVPITKIFKVPLNV